MEDENRPAGGRVGSRGRKPFAPINTVIIVSNKLQKHLFYVILLDSRRSRNTSSAKALPPAGASAATWPRDPPCPRLRGHGIARVHGDSRGLPEARSVAS